MSAALEPFLRALVRAVQPLKAALSDPQALKVLIRAMGWEADLSAVLTSNPKLVQLSKDVTDLATEGEALLTKLETATDKAAVITDLLPVAMKVGVVIGDIGTWSQSDLDTLPVELQDSAFWAELALDLPEYLLIRYLMVYAPAWAAFLQLVGVLRVTRVEADTSTGGLVRQAFWRRELVWDNLTALLSNPGGYFAGRYCWNDPVEDLRSDELLTDLNRLLLALGVKSRLQPLRAKIATDHYGSTPTDGIRELDVALLSEITDQGFAELGILLAPVPSTPGSRLDGVLLSNLSYGSAASSRDLGNGFKLEASSVVEASGSFGVALDPAGPRVVGKVPSGRMTLTLTGAPATPWRIFGAEAGSRLELSGLQVGVVFEGSSTPDVGISAAMQDASGEPGLALIVAASEGDGFLRKILGDAEIRADFGVEVSWSAREGLVLAGSLALDTTLVVDRAVGPLTICTIWLHAGAELGSKAGLLLAAAITARLELGPFKAVVERLGAGVTLVPDATGQGTFGKLDLAPRFVPPTGLGLSIDTKVVSGGGFLSLDPDKGRYAGILDLDIEVSKELSIGLTAIGVLTTGADDFSLFFSLSATFAPAIQLGFGFTLSGIGGLFGVNRRLDPEGLKAATKAGQLDAVLFPEDPVEEADEIFAAIDQIFPIDEGSYVFGPMLELAWGTPTLISAQLGLFISLPDPIVIAVLGQVSMTLPNDEPVLTLNMDVAGVVDLSAGTIAVDAKLVDSRLLDCKLSGEMAFRARFKDKPSFLLSVGGFHPAFEPPDDVGALERMKLELAVGKHANLVLTAYFAVTSNTLQLGAAVSLTAKLKIITFELEIDGGASFDALLTFKPFSIDTAFSAWVHIKYKGEEVLACDVHLALTGPSPSWHATGSATIEIQKLSIQHTWEFDERFGGAPTLPPTKLPVRAPLLEALEAPAAWVSTEPAPGAVRHRALLDSERAAGRVWVRPDGGLEIRQNVVPLGLRLEQLGAGEPAEVGPFALGDARVGGVNVSASTVKGLFAPGAYLDLAPAERLSGPSFEEMPSGIRIGPSGLNIGDVEMPTVSFTEVYVRPPPSLPSTLSVASDIAFTGVTTSSLAAADTDAVVLAERPGWVQQDASKIGPTSTWSEARQSVQDALAADPSARPKLRVLPADASKKVA